MTKFKKVFKEMQDENVELFNEFKIIHDKFSKDNKKHRQEFNELGEKVVAIIRKYEDILCGRSEGSGFGNFTSKLADKLWTEVRNIFPEIDEVGIT